MTRRILSLIAVTAIFGLLIVMSPATSASEVNCRIPFSFTVNGKALPPGLYTMSTSNGMLLVRGHESGAAAMTNGLSSLTDKEMKAVFEKNGDRYELIEVWTGEGAGRQLLRPRPNP